MKSNKEYQFKATIESVNDVIVKLRDAEFGVTCYRRCDLEGNTIGYRVSILDTSIEYEVNTVEDCLKFIVNDAVMLGEMIKIGAISED